MRMMRLVWNDLKKDLIWILIFGVVTSLLFICLFLYLNSYKSIRERSAVLRKMEEKNVCFLEPYDGVWFEDGQPAMMPAKDTSLMENYLKENFTADGIGGFSMSIGADNRTFKVQRMYLVGKETLLTSYDYDPKDGIVCMGKKGVLEKQGKTVKMDGKTYEIGLLPDEFIHFTRLGEERLDNELVIFCPTYEDYLKIDPDKEAKQQGHVQDHSMYLMNSILVDPAEEEVRQFQRMSLEGAGYYTTLQSMTQYLSQTDNKGERTHLLYVIFYAVAGIALLTAMVINLIRMMKRKFADYAVHHLYGEDYGHIYLRMNLYALGYQSVALFLFLYLTGDNNMLTPWMAVGAVLLVIMISLIVSLILYREFMENIVIYLRRRAE